MHRIFFPDPLSFNLSGPGGSDLEFQWVATQRYITKHVRNPFGRQHATERHTKPASPVRAQPFLPQPIHYTVRCAIGKSRTIPTATVSPTPRQRTPRTSQRASSQHNTPATPTEMQLTRHAFGTMTVPDRNRRCAASNVESNIGANCPLPFLNQCSGCRILVNPIGNFN